MLSIRATKKEQTRRKIIDAAFKQLTAEKGFSSLSLREVAKEAGIAPTSFYVHFKDMNDLGLTLLDEAGLLLRQIMRSARRKIIFSKEDITNNLSAKNSATISSVNTFFKFINEKPNILRFLLREISGTSDLFRTSINREQNNFILELAEYISLVNPNIDKDIILLETEMIVILVFFAGSKALDMNKTEQKKFKEKIIKQIRIILDQNIK